MSPYRHSLSKACDLQYRMKLEIKWYVCKRTRQAAASVQILRFSRRGCFFPSEGGIRINFRSNYSWAERTREKWSCGRLTQNRKSHKKQSSFVTWLEQNLSAIFWGSERDRAGQFSYLNPAEEKKNNAVAWNSLPVRQLWLHILFLTLIE